MVSHTEKKIALVIGGTAADGRSSIGAAISHFLNDLSYVVLPVSSQRNKVKATLKAIAQPDLF